MGNTQFLAHFRPNPQRLPSLRAFATPTLILGLAALAGCHRHSALHVGSAMAESSSPPLLRPAQSLSFSTPERMRFEPELQATGTLKPERSAQLAAQVPGRLSEVLVKRGQEVTAGTVLARLDSSAARASLAQAEAAISASEAQLRVADDALRRATGLYKENAMPESHWVQAKGQREAAAAQHRVAEAQREQALLMLRNHNITAPFAGVVVRSPDGVGFMVGPQVPLFLLESSRVLIMETSLSQDEAAVVDRLGRVEVSVPATGALVRDAQISALLPTVDPATNRVPIEVRVSNPDLLLLPHSSARARLPARGARDAFRVPAAALTQRDGAFSLWMANSKGRAISVAVRVLARQPGELAVVEPTERTFPVNARVVDTPPLGIAEGVPLAGAAAQ